MKCRVAHKSVSFDVEVRPACGTTVLKPRGSSGTFPEMSNFILPASFKTHLFILRKYLRLDSVVSRVSVQQDNECTC